jgi:phage/plasmid primase-like uncharacterized protein
MKILILALVIVASTAQAEMVITDKGNYLVQQTNSTTYVTGPSHTTVPVAVNPVTGIGQVHTPQGSYLVQRSSTGTTTVIQTSKSK